MSDEKGTFVAIGESEQRLFGPTAIVLCGFSPDGQKALRQLWAQSGLGEIPVRAAAAADLQRTCLEVAEGGTLLTATPEGVESSMPRAVLLSGLMERQVTQVMRIYRESGAPAPLWAALTEHSQSWPLSGLLRELEQERKAFEKMSAEGRKRG